MVLLAVSWQVRFWQSSCFDGSRASSIFQVRVRVFAELGNTESRDPPHDRHLAFDAFTNDISSVKAKSHAPGMGWRTRYIGRTVVLREALTDQKYNEHTRGHET